MTSTPRVFEGRRIWRLPEETFLNAARLIAEAEGPYRPQAVVGIARGGTRLAEVVAAHLEVDAIIVHARHNVDDACVLQATGQVRLDGEQPSVERFPRGARLLMVDDIAGSGATLRTVHRWLCARIQPAVLRSAVLCRNCGTGTAPDTWGWDVADWVRFPWEGPLNDVTEPLPVLTTLHHRQDQTARRPT
ncbi:MULTISPECIES: phosphoribosyltransferase [Streptomyces]|uniref:phosphoribosyltransferase n=1 Tax=Streptomyces TaxID=1883 RepID=UPI00163C15CE|nr:MULTISPECIES: phosphoribosyltransferase family protein [Streptomyces]MBC2879320.1 phosphoribosyltransferase [Streptomyces sp. TYQ1024]UBI40080.1 phosphoribosyltransferase domain-containing protein [Streptomyces mobaraensis]UKW32659.1 phosphoribosyltransferase domain-containing protein [Streptomyces sp. TYQ1024]